MHGSSFSMRWVSWVSGVSSTGTGALLSLFLPVTAFTTPFTALRFTLVIGIALVSDGATSAEGESLSHGSKEAAALIYLLIHSISQYRAASTEAEAPEWTDGESEERDEERKPERRAWTSKDGMKRTLRAYVWMRSSPAFFVSGGLWPSYEPNYA